MALRVGDTIETGPEYTAAISFDGATAMLSPDTKIELIPGGIRDWFREVFNSGWLNGESKLVTAAHESTEYVLSVDPQTQHTTVTVLEGIVRVTPKDRAATGLLVKARQRVTVDGSGNPLLVVELGSAELNGWIEKGNLMRDQSQAPLLPDLRGEQRDEAIRKLKALGVELEEVDAQSRTPAVVLEQKPEPGVRSDHILLTYGDSRGADRPGVPATTQRFASITAPRAVEAGTSLSFKWAASSVASDRIVLVPAEADDGMHWRELTVAANSKQPATLLAPARRGDYELRYTTDDGLILARWRLTVTAPPQATVSAPSQAEAGSEIEFAWTGPSHSTDSVSLVPVAESTGHYPELTVSADSQKPAKLRVPANSGEYELRYVVGGLCLTPDDCILARQALRVTQASATLTVPSQVEAGARFRLSWAGPNHPTDSINLVPAGTSDKEFRHEQHLQADLVLPATMQAPSEPGEYQLRYVLGRSLQGTPPVILARAQVNVTAASATLNAPSRVKAGAQFAVSWRGPNYAEDKVQVAPQGVRDDGYLRGLRIDVSGKKSATLSAPTEPGDYELRYVLIGQKVIGRRALKVVAH